MRARFLAAIFELALKTVPHPWRDSVRQDIVEEASGREGRRGFRWKCAQAFAIGVRLRRRQPAASPRATATWMMPSVFAGAARLFRRDRLSSLAIVGGLGIGIGTVITAQAVFNFAVFRPVPGVRNEASLVSVFFQPDHATPNRTAPGLTYLRGLRDAVPAIDGLASAAQKDLPLALAPGAAPRITAVYGVTRDYFEVLGVRARIGRLFERDEYESAAAPVAVISDRMWRRDFDRAADAVGRVILVNGDRFTIVGVTDRFQGPQQIGRGDLWLPAGATHAFSPKNPDWHPAQELIGHLRPGATIAQAQAEALAAAKSLPPIRISEKVYLPQIFAGLTDGVGLTTSRLMAIYRVLMIGVGLLLLLACANAANLMLARNVRRAKDFALSAAIGATRARILRELVTEAALLSFAAGACGLALAAAAVRLFSHVRLLSYLPALEGVSLDLRVAAFTFAAAGVTTLCFGVAPAIVASRANPQDALRAASTRATPRGRLRSVFVAVQLALSLTLVVGAAVLTRTVLNLRALDLGMNIEHVFAFSLRPPQIGYDDAGSGRVIEEIVERLRHSPGIDGVATSWGTPIESISTRSLTASGHTDAVPVRDHQVSAEFFDVMQIPFLAGRSFTAQEARIDLTASSIVPAILSAKGGRMLFGEANPVGEHLSSTFGRRVITLEVIGVVGDTRSQNLRQEIQPNVFVPFGLNNRNTTIALRTPLPVSTVTEIERAVLRSVDPALAAGTMRPLSQDIDDAMAEERLLARLGVVVAVAAGLLAIAGLYAVVAYFVAERVREFGVRLALGAPRAAITTLVLRRVLALCVGGLVIGLTAIALSGKLLAARLYGVTPTDAVTVAGAAVALVSIALAAAWIPARRAGAIDPAITLRAE